MLKRWQEENRGNTICFNFAKTCSQEERRWEPHRSPPQTLWSSPLWFMRLTTHTRWKFILHFNDEGYVSLSHTNKLVCIEDFVKFLHFIFVTLTTVVADADERFGKAYLRWASPVAISEIKPDLRFKKKVIHRNHEVATCFQRTARPASQAKVCHWSHHHHYPHEIWTMNAHQPALVATT